MSQPMCLPYQSPDVIQHTVVRLESLLIHAADAEERIAAVEAEAERCRAKRVRLQNSISRCRALISLVRRLPTAVLTRIFALLPPDDLASLSAVCRKWHAAAQPAHLWSRFTVTNEGFRSERKTVLFLCKAGVSPLDVAHTPSMAHSLSSAWRHVLGAARRWRSLTLDLEDSLAAAEYVAQLPPTRNLTTLRVHIRAPCARPADDAALGLETPLFAVHMPRLRTLHLETPVLPTAQPGPVFAQLTALHITDTFADLPSPTPASLRPMSAMQLLNILHHCPALTTLTFAAGASFHALSASPDRRPLYGPLISLPALRNLDIDAHVRTGTQLLTHIAAPHLRTAHIRLRPRHALRSPAAGAAEAANTLARFLARTHGGLCELRASGVPAQCIIPMAHPSLETLRLHHCSGVARFLARLTHDLEADAFPPPLPLLTALHIDANPFDVPARAIAALVRARWDARTRGEGAGVCALRSVVVNGRDVVRDVPGGEVCTVVQHVKRFGGAVGPWGTGEAEGE